MAAFNRFRKKNRAALRPDDDIEDIARARLPGAPTRTGTPDDRQTQPVDDARAAEEARRKEEADRKRQEIIDRARDRHGKDKDGDGYDDDLGDIARMRAEQGAERKAREDELRVSKEKALQQADARSGLGGFGLSGASAALRSDLGRQHDRNAAITMGDLGRRQRDEEWKIRQREVALWELEAEMDRDLDGDGKVAGVKVGGTIGDGDPTNDGGAAPTPEKEKDRSPGRVANDIITGIGRGAADLFGRGAGAREQQAQEGALHTPDAPEGANVTEYPASSRDNREAQIEASGYSWETVTDDGVTVYRNNESPFDRLYVRWV